jgi:hypothetical protein
VEIKPHTNRAFNQDIFHYLTTTQGSDNLPPDISISKLDEHDTHPRIAVGKYKYNKPEVDTIKRVVEECYMTVDHAENEEYDDQPPVRPLREIMEVYNTEWGDPHNADPGPGTMTVQEDLDHAAPGQEPGNRHQEDRLPYMYEKPDLGDILDRDQRKDHYMVRDDAVHEVTKYETHQQGVTKICSKLADNTHLEEEESVDTYMDDANDTHQQDVTKAYKTTDDAQHLMMCGQSISRAFFINKALPEVCIIQRGDATSLTS